MITLKDDRLSFSFPEIGEQIRRRVAAHIQTTLQRLLAEDRRSTVAELESMWWWKDIEVNRQRKAVEKLLNATPAEIEAALRAKCPLHATDDDLAIFGVAFQRTLRIPDDGTVYSLPPSLGNFPLRHVDDFEKTVPESWLKRGGVMMPMYQSEALWLRFSGSYPCAVKIGSGKINALTGESWTAGLSRDPQDYLVRPEQPWLDGFAVRKGVIRQFVAMPLGDGYSVEEQLTGRADVGGVQLQVYPMKADAYFEKHLAAELPMTFKDILEELVGELRPPMTARYCMSAAMPCPPADGMGLGAGGTMRQEIYDDPNDFADWDTGTTSRCLVHLCNSLVWRQITGSNPPHPPLTAKEYTRAGFPWFDYYRDDLPAIKGSKILDSVKSIFQLGKAKGTNPLPENASVKPELTVQYGSARRPNEVREWAE